MNNCERPEEKLSTVAFREIAGITIGAIAVGALVTGVALYRGAAPRRALTAGIGGGTVGAIGFVGFGNDAYEDLRKLLGSHRSASTPTSNATGRQR